jgi:hypothetical protein
VDGLKYLREYIKDSRFIRLDDILVVKSKAKTPPTIKLNYLQKKPKENDWLDGYSFYPP